jgi:hypothetical protein
LDAIDKTPWNERFLFDQRLLNRPGTFLASFRRKMNGAAAAGTRNDGNSPQSRRGRRRLVCTSYRITAVLDIKTNVAAQSPG